MFFDKLLNKFKADNLKLIMINFPKRTWEDIETVVPDEWDLKMIHDAKNNPDCKEFISPEGTMKELGIDITKIII
jgi:hypothetical protein